MAGITLLSELVPYMIQDLPGYQPGTALAALRASAREFCRRSDAWWEELTAIDLVDEQVEYTLTTTEDAAVKSVRAVHVLSEQDVTDSEDGTELENGIDYRLSLPTTLILNDNWKPSANVTGGLVVEVILVPLPEANSLPAWLLTRYSDAIIYQALHRLLKVRDPDRARYFLGQYNEKLNEGLVDTAEDIGA